MYSNITTYKLQPTQVVFQTSQVVEMGANPVLGYNY